MFGGSVEDLQVGLWLVVGGFIIHPMFENTLVKQKDREEDVRVNWESTEKKNVRLNFIQL